MSAVVCPTCGATGDQHCSTMRGNDHRKRMLLEIQLPYIGARPGADVRRLRRGWHVMAKLVRLVALGEDGRERGAIDGPELTIGVTEDGEIQVTNGRSGLYGPIAYDWSDLVPDFRRGETVRLELQIVDGWE